MLSIEKTFKFDAAHILTNHSGLCKNLHGHTYRVVVRASCEDGDADMVMDFKDVKRICEEKIVAQFDHSFIYDSTSPAESEIAATLEKYGMRTARLPFRSTAENIARTIFGMLKDSIPGLCSVKVRETPDSCAEYSGES